jgi:putative ABC transport system permease protein
MLLFDWRRYLAAVLAVTFSGLLVIVQLALLLGMFSTVSVVIDRSNADLWIGYRNTQSVDLGRPIAREADARAWAHHGVERTERYASVYGDLRRNDGVPVSVIINGIDTSPSALAFAKLLSPAQRALLRSPDAILIDAADTHKLGAFTGAIVEINGKRASIVGVVEGLRAIGGGERHCLIRNGADAGTGGRKSAVFLPRPPQARLRGRARGPRNRRQRARTALQRVGRQGLLCSFADVLAA